MICGGVDKRNAEIVQRESRKALVLLGELHIISCMRALMHKPRDKGGNFLGHKLFAIHAVASVTLREAMVSKKLQKVHFPCQGQNEHICFVYFPRKAFHP